MTNKKLKEINELMAELTKLSSTRESFIKNITRIQELNARLALKRKALRNDE